MVAEMKYQNSKTWVCGGPILQTKRKVGTTTALTILEMLIALAITAIVFAAILPQFRAILNSWDSRAGAAKALQNGRVLMDHLNRNLATAVRVTAVSDSTQVTGYIEFEDNDGNNLRYDVAANNYVEFGSVGDLYELAGPVSQLQFTCYDGNDFENPLIPDDVNSIRFVKVGTTLTNSAELGRDLAFTAQVYLRTNSEPCSGTSGLVGFWKLDETSGSVAYDSSGSGNNGDLVSEATWAPTSGILGGALSFGQTAEDGVAISTTEMSVSAGTIALWGWLEAGTQSDYRFFFGVKNDAGNRIQLYMDSGTWLDLGLGDAHHRHDDIYQFNVETWYHIALTWDGGNYAVYVNGDEEVVTGSYTGLNILMPVANIGNNGDNRVPDRVQAFHGLIDDVRIYDRALSAEEIEELADILAYQEFTEAKAASDVTSITISTPSDTNEGDLLIAAVATDGDTDFSLSPPLGEDWTEIDVADYSSEVTLGAWWKLADASESSSHEFAWSGDQQAYGWMMRFTGHDPDDPVDVYATDGETSSTPTSPAVTTTVANTMILRLGAFDDDDITVDDPGLAGHTAITMDRSASGAGLVTYQEFTEAKLPSNDMSVTISTPGGTSEGDLLVAAVVTDGDTKYLLSPPAGEGWTIIDLDYYNGNATTGVWWKFADASESPSHQFSWEDYQQAYGWIMRFTGHDPITPIDVSAGQGGSSSSPECPSVTTTVANTLIVRIGGFDDDDITEDNPGLSGHTAITMDRSNTGQQGTCAGGAGYVQQPAIGDSGTSNFSLTAQEQYRTVTIAIAPAAGGGGGGSVSGGAGYVKQSATGDSGTYTFSLTASQQSQTVTIAIAPNPQSSGGSGDCEILP